MELKDGHIPPLQVKVIISQKEGKPCIELRRAITETEAIKFIISCAYHNQPIVITPAFTNTLKSISSLVDKGILYRKGDRYFFTI